MKIKTGSDDMNYIDKIKKSIKDASRALSITTAMDKNDALKKVAIELNVMRDYILEQNEIDIENAKKSGMKESLIDRLKLNDDRINEMIGGIETVIAMTDPVGRSNQLWTLENGLEITKITVPMGVIAIIYEGRPNVTVDAFALALKSGNAIILRGSASAINSNMALEKAITKGLSKSNITTDVIHLIKDTDRKIVNEILTADGIVDLAIPRGGHDLISMVIKNATVPTLQTGEGNNHIYVDESADIQMAVNIIKNAKMQRVGTCNTVEKLLVHENIAESLLTALQEETADKLEFHADERSSKILKNAKNLEEDELYTEYLDYILGVKIVGSMDEAIEHINKYGTMHSEAIVTNNLDNTIKFQKAVDASAVYVNASTRFTDGGQFGFGLEMGISTQKMHARGPVGLGELVTTKYLIVGNGQVRK
ncbi:glutamate-5-semialdehyde dehydrogenase [[Eubacterium] yurii subsp. margaretiae ATCC 43715]|nr:glutamate-5-semialdehyde dehydrogenase [[Eubacterium] yurii subsp. margaretiae ATCC 43715]